MLKLMQHWERHAYFLDGFIGVEDREENARVNHIGESYARSHSNDPRPAWRSSSNHIRPCRGRCHHSLMQLVLGRMNEDPAFTHIQVLGNLSVNFELRRELGRTRTLQYVLAESGSHEWDVALLALRGRVSTLAVPGAAGILPNITRSQHAW
eukprot:CAMPEP_0119317432 /NCGR_PEP_ID=MMETSP1333-20130426/43119_1 /TAXON_ID=418940 /ORGANISM="Scyphosphaera apsteinii, Strain RCC1455" /LENGTH=151 /DNA_ID=CAMNT_0007323365 /DNA_START=408 /DNA_END=860 /DNA_ORIENTATION=+